MSGNLTRRVAKLETATAPDSTRPTHLLFAQTDADEESEIAARIAAGAHPDDMLIVVRWAAPREGHPAVESAGA